MILYNESKQNIAKVGKAKKSKKKGVGSIVTFQLFWTSLFFFFFFFMSG
jgi:hypothetical protein